MTQVFYSNFQKSKIHISTWEIFLFLTGISNHRKYSILPRYKLLFL